MPKYYTFPYLFDERKSLSITDLKTMNYFTVNSKRGGTVNWTRQGENTGSISIIVSFTNENNYIDFDYTCNGNNHNYRVYLISLQSNLGKGKVWYFQCRFTGKRCRKLHLINERFQHRTASKNGMYSTQTKSKKWRSIEKVYSSYFDSENIYSELYRKHFKKSYNGKPTKKYLKLMQKIKEIENINPADIEMLLLS